MAVALALLGVVLGSTGAFAAGPDASGEPCFSCAGCESGECGDGDQTPLTSHHHCCTTCCLSHASMVFSAAHASPAPMMARSTVRTASVAVASRAAETPDRPPRV